MSHIVVVKTKVQDVIAIAALIPAMIGNDFIAVINVMYVNVLSA